MYRNKKSRPAFYYKKEYCLHNSDPVNISNNIFVRHTFLQLLFFSSLTVEAGTLLYSILLCLFLSLNDKNRNHSNPLLSHSRLLHSETLTVY